MLLFQFGWEMFRPIQLPIIEDLQQVKLYLIICLLSKIIQKYTRLAKSIETMTYSDQKLFGKICFRADLYYLQNILFKVTFTPFVPKMLLNFSNFETAF